MPLPLLFIVPAVAAGMVGVGNSAKAVVDSSKAKKINKNANEIVEEATNRINSQRFACGNSLRELGEEKVFVLNNNIKSFLDIFTRIKNVDFTKSVGLEELKKMHIDKQDFVEMKSMVNYVASLAGGTVAGAAGGAATALGAYGAASALAAASTGTAISTLSGAAATNATLAFFGGGSLAAGGLGMAGGAAVLGGLVAGPALLALGLVVGKAARKDLDKALTNQDEAIQIATQFEVASQQCEAIRKRTYMFYTLLARLETYFLPLIYKMEEIFENEGDDYSKYSKDSQKVIASCASVAVTIKSILDTPILTDDGLLTDESEKTTGNVEQFLDNLQIAY